MPKNSACCNIKEEEDNQNHKINCEKLDVEKVNPLEFKLLFGNNVEKMSNFVQKVEKIVQQINNILEDKLQ